jgi:Styrene monooxygenase A putative substrate binding domain
MKSIGIVGAGQSGLQLAIGLRQAGYPVVLLSAQTPEEIRNGRVTSSQCMFGTALEHERRLDLNLWDDRCPAIEGIEFAVAAGDAQPQLRWDARLEKPARSVDQRVKMPELMERFRALGGELRFQEVHLQDLEALTRECALAIVSAGKGAIANIFERDAVRSDYDRPMRALALTYVNGLVPRNGFAAVCFNLIPGVGEYFVFPALTTSGPCEIMVFEAVPGGPMDCWGDVRSPEHHLETSLSVLKQFVPWEFERARSVSLTDAQGILAGRFPPTVRHPLARLPSGAVVLGMGDVVCLNDPITGQGSNNASKCAAVYLQRILERGADSYDTEWMRETFETYWRYAQYVTRWTNMMLRPPPEHMLQLLGAGGTRPEVARWFVNGFDNPPALFPHITDAAAAKRFLDTVS